MNARCSTPETICVQCGDRGFTNAFVYCVKCLKVAVHRYCLDIIPNTVDEFVQWVCHDCDAKVQNQPAVCKTRDHSTYNHVQVLERSMDGNFGGKNDTNFEDNNVQNVKQQRPITQESALTFKRPAPTMESGSQSTPEQSVSSQTVHWIRQPVQRLKPTLNLYVKTKICSQIRDVLHAVGGEEAVQMFRSGCFGYFLDFLGGSNCSKGLHALMGREIHTPNSAVECWFHINGTNIRFSPAEYALVTGLRFGGSNFDPNEDHHIPQSGIFYRLFQGKRTTIAQMLKKFLTQHLANSPADYVKVANILFVYNMLICIDPIRAIESWMWALIEDVERWNSFPWGAYSYQLLMHYISLVPKSRATMSRGGTGSYHFYGPIWTLQTWAYEVIPEMGRQCAVPNGQLTMPRCLKWSFFRVVADFSTFFDRHLEPLVLMVPTPQEVLASYWLSLQEGDIFGVKYVVLRKPSKKKSIGQLASLVLQVPMTHAETTIADASLSRPRRTRQSGQSAPQSTSGLVDEPDEIVEETDETSDSRAPRMDPILDLAPTLPRTKRARGSQSQSGGEHVFSEHLMPGQCLGEDADSWFDRFAQRVAHHLRSMVDDSVGRHIRGLVDEVVARLGSSSRYRSPSTPTPECVRQPTPPPQSDR